MTGSAPKAFATSSPPADLPADWPGDVIEVGKILDAYGVKGWMKVQSHSKDPGALMNASRWYLRLPPAPRPVARSKPQPDSSAATTPASVASTTRSGTEWRVRPTAKAPSPGVLSISARRLRGDDLVAQAAEIEDRDAAESLRGAVIYVSRSDFPSSDPDEFYWVDLIGLSVVNLEEQSLGRIVGLIDTGPHTVIRVLPDDLPKDADTDEAERLIPFVSAYVTEVSLEKRRVVVDWGLDY